MQPESSYRRASQRTLTWRRGLAAVLGALLLVPALSAGTPASALQQDNDRLPSADPIDTTPRVRDGAVYAIARSGNRVFVGGSFTEVQNGNNSTIQTRNRLFSYNHLTGQVDAWNPNMNGTVEALAVSPDGRWLYAGGFFSQSDGGGAPRIARFDTTTGARDTSFKPAANKGINDLQLRGDVLYMAGPFDTVAGQPRAGLAAVDATTGALLSLDLPLSEPQTSGTQVSGRKMDVTADGSKLVIVGNFRRIAGADRPQLAMVDLDGNGGGAVDADWRTNSYSATCARAFDSYMRDVEFSPDGTFIVVNTTGAWGGTSKLCDTSARFEVGATGTSITPTWVDFTGGDTLYGVAITSSAVFIGGHQRWVNNSAPSRGDTAGPGSVARDGIAALDPLTGVPLSWNPGKERGVGTFDITVSADTLFIGHDTNIVAGEFRPRLSAFPYGTATNVAPRAIDLPATLYQGRTDRSLRKADVATGGVSSVATAPSAGIDWRNLRGAFHQNGQLYAWGLPGGTFTSRSYDGTSAGVPTDLVAQAGYVIAPNNVSTVRAAAYQDGRIYYLRSGSSQLFWRWFSLESGILGSQEFVASSSNWSSVTGIEVAGGQMYLTRTDGRLYRSAISGGSVSTSFTLVNSSTNWNSGNDLFFLPGTGGQVPDTTPPSQPGRPTAASTDAGEATVSWDAATDDTSTQLTYQVFRDGGAVPVGTVTAGTSGTVSFTDTGLTPGNIHSWTVRAVDGAGNTGALSPASDPVVIAGQAGPAPIAQSDFSDGLARWTGVSGLSVDPAQGSTAAPSALAAPSGGASTARLALSVPASSSCTSVDVRFSSVTGTARYALLKLRTAGNASIARVWVDRNGRLSVRNDLTNTRYDTTTNLPTDQWAEVTLCARVDGAAGSLTLLVNGVEAGDWTTDTGSAPYAELQLGDNDGRTAEIRFDDVEVIVPGAGEVIADTTPPSAPGRPTAASTTAGAATVTWEAATDDRSPQLTYQVFRDGGASPVGTVSGGTSGTVSFTDTGLTPGDTHSYAVRAVDGAGNVGELSAVSDPVTVAAPAGPALAQSDFSDGLARWTGVNGLSVDAAQGSASAPSALAAPSGTASTARLALAAPANSSCTSVDVRFTSITGNERYALLKLRTAGNASIARVWIDRWGRLSVRNDLTNTRLDTTTNLPTDQWARVTLCAEVNGGAGSLTLLVDGAQAGTWTTDTGSAPYAELQLGDNDARTAEIRFDDVEVTAG